MTTMLDDYLHMDCEGASTINGYKLLLGTNRGIFSIAIGAMFPFASIVNGILIWKDKWPTAFQSDRADIVAALRTSAKVAKTGAVILAKLA